MDNQDFLDSLSVDQAAALVAYRDDLNQTRDDQQIELREAFDSEMSELQASLDAEKQKTADLTEELRNATAEAARLEKELTETKALIWDVRTLSADALFQRFTSDEIQEIMASDDSAVVDAMKELRRKRQASELIDMDSTKHQTAIQSLVSAGVISAKRAPELLADSRSDEAKARQR